MTAFSDPDGRWGAAKDSLHVMLRSLRVVLPLDVVADVALRVKDAEDAGDSLAAALREMERTEQELRTLLDEVGLDRAGIAGRLSAVESLLRETERQLREAREAWGRMQKASPRTMEWHDAADDLAAALRGGAGPVKLAENIDQHLAEHPESDAYDAAQKSVVDARGGGFS